MEIRTELSMLWGLGCVGMVVVSALSLVEKLFVLMPVKALIMLYCVLGALSLMPLECVHISPTYFDKDGCLMRNVVKWRTTMVIKALCLSTLRGRGLAYIFFGSLT